MLLKESFEINKYQQLSSEVQNPQFHQLHRTPRALSSGQWRDFRAKLCHGSYIQQIEVSGCQNPWNFIRLVIPKLRSFVVGTRIFSACQICQARRKDALTNMGCESGF